mmetsp:Transcript_8322/g.17789  ORF Transcript_8322/g.17789 Transcript_8322/m.17789 type:complete len:223 (-) Transcript_8322:3039-3707(-)
MAPGPFWAWTGRGRAARPALPAAGVWWNRGTEQGANLIPKRSSSRGEQLWRCIVGGAERGVTLRWGDLRPLGMDGTPLPLRDPNGDLTRTAGGADIAPVPLRPWYLPPKWEFEGEGSMPAEDEGRDGWSPSSELSCTACTACSRDSRLLLSVTGPATACLAGDMEVSLAWRCMWSGAAPMICWPCCACCWGPAGAGGGPMSRPMRPRFLGGRAMSMSDRPVP